jgi:IS30 family transposase
MQILNQQEREQIAFYRRLKLSLRDIAKRLDRNVSVVSRELQRNRSRDGRYVPAEAQTKAERRAHKTKKITPNYTLAFQFLVEWMPKLNEIFEQTKNPTVSGDLVGVSGTTPELEIIFEPPQTPAL